MVQEERQVEGEVMHDENDPSTNLNGDVSNGLGSSQPNDATTVTATATPRTASNGGGGSTRTEQSVADTMDKVKLQKRRIGFFLLLLVVDLLVSLVLLTPFIPFIAHLVPWIPFVPGETRHFTFYGALLDLALLTLLRVLACGGAIVHSYCRATVRPEYPFALHRYNGERKTREELEEEALEEDFRHWFYRFATRSAFATEILAVLAQIVCVVKSLWRMNMEIGVFHHTQPGEHYHPLFWVAIVWTALISMIQTAYLDSVTQLAAQCGDRRSHGNRNRRRGLLRTISSTLSIPLLAADQRDEEEPDSLEDAINADQQENGTPTNDEVDAVGVSDIRADTEYKASWTDLLRICTPDAHLLCFAFIFLILAAISQALIPLFLGHVLDALSEAFQDPDNHPDDNHDDSMFDIPGFVTNMKWLVLVSVSAGVFAGLRGSTFSVVGGRVVVRLRLQLMDSLLAQDIGFFDVTKTGEITSRLSSDTTLVGDQVTLNVNIFLRSLVQAIGVLGFMFTVSWQLSILAFISVPVITHLSRWYGDYVRSLTKLMQKKLADGNSVSEAVFSAMPTVRSFDAAEHELQEFEACMQRYLQLNVRSAIAYCGYAGMTTSLPQLVFAVVVFYGGLMVRNGDMTSGQLVSFLLYLQSLSDAISSIGWVFSALTQAVGAADKVFELLHRKPRSTPPSSTELNEDSYTRRQLVGNLRSGVSKTTRRRLQGVIPPSVRGEIKLQDVVLYYPARPQRRVLNGLSLDIKPGSIVALVGQSGGGKSSVMSLIQHLYEPQSGKVMIDGYDVHELCPSWLARHVSIVSQEPTLFARSIKRNIMYGLEGTDMEPTQEDIEEAARLANADSFIQSMPQKYETEVGERGVQLSGGQKQRIAIARALVRRPRVLLLDEATSALDAESEHLVQKAIDDMIARGKNNELGAPMTVIIVAHRLSTVRSADRIFVVKNGSVVEEGSHNELIANPTGAYASLIRRQLEAQQMLDSGASNATTAVNVETN